MGALKFTTYYMVTHLVDEMHLTSTSSTMQNYITKNYKKIVKNNYFAPRRIAIY